MLDVNLLLQRECFRELNDAALIALAHGGSSTQAKKGERINAESVLGESVYLIEGEVDILSDNGINITVSADSERAKLPLFRFNAHGMYLQCRTPVTLLRFPRVLIRKLSIHDNSDKVGISVEEYEESESEGGNSIYIDEIREQFHSNAVTLPALPEIALYINSAIDEQNMNFSRLGGIVQTDPTISARIVNVANSALFGHPAKIDSIAQAITRIGLDSVRVIVMSVIVRNLFEPKSALVKKYMIEFYEHSVRIGVISYVLAKRLPDMNCDHAFLAGILHDIGVVPLLVVADKHPELSHQAGHLDKILTELKREVGSMLLRQWEFADEYADITRDAYDWNRKNDNADYCDLVQVALMHSHLVGGEKIKGPALNALPAFRRLGMHKLNPSDNIKLLNDLSKRVKEMIKLLCQNNKG